MRLNLQVFKQQNNQGANHVTYSRLLLNEESGSMRKKVKAAFLDIFDDVTVIFQQHP